MLPTSPPGRAIREILLYAVRVRVEFKQESPMQWRFPREVPGSLSEAEGSILAELARGRTVLEIGSYAGRSTICMAQTAARVHSVDWHKGDKDVGDTFTVAALISNLTRYSVREKVCLYVGDACGFLPIFPDGSLSFAFVDGGHTYDQATHDIREACRIVSPLGKVAVHDYNFPEVRRALADMGYADLTEEAGSLVVIRPPLPQSRKG
jgi:predicted O-methyltransferase YrrM